MCLGADWLRSQGTVIVYERRVEKQVYYVLPIRSILGKLPVVPVGDTGTIPFSQRRHAEEYVDAAFDSREGAGDGSRWWYVNVGALSWSHAK